MLFGPLLLRFQGFGAEETTRVLAGWPWMGTSRAASGLLSFKNLNNGDAAILPQMPCTLTASSLNLGAVKELNLSYFIVETLFVTIYIYMYIYTHDGN